MVLQSKHTSTNTCNVYNRARGRVGTNLPLEGKIDGSKTDLLGFRLLFHDCRARSLATSGDFRSRGCCKLIVASRETSSEEGRRLTALFVLPEGWYLEVQISLRKGECRLCLN